MSISCKVMFLPIVSVILLGGCAVAPKVELTQIDGPKDVTGEEVDTFYLRKSIIRIDKTESSTKKENTELPKLTIQSMVEEHDEFKIGIKKADKVGVRTNLNITKLPNTGLIKEAGVEVKDTRIDMINKVGGVVVKAVSAGMLNDASALEVGDLPKLIPINDLLKDNNIKRDAVMGIEIADGIKMSIGRIPPDAVEIGNLKMPVKMKGLIYSSCRTATIEFSFGDEEGPKYKKTMKINDPRYLQRVSFPIKGKVVFHSECGVSVTSEKDTGVSTGADIIDALAAQGKAIKDAIDAAKKEDK